MPRDIEVDGRHILYHYLQKELLTQDIWLFQMLLARLVTALGVWLHPEIYTRLPLLRPYAVRDPTCRGSRARGLPDEWGSADQRGRFRDDNSLIKRLPAPLRVAGPVTLYRGRRLGSGFVAAHVWRQLTDGGLAARNERTFSFVPNLVWLPEQVAKLTDREGSFAQLYLQALSRRIFRPVRPHAALTEVVDASWRLLPEPLGIPEQGLPDPSDLNYFIPDAAFFRRRWESVSEVTETLREIAIGQPIRGKVVAPRYGPSLEKRAPAELAALTQMLTEYRDATAAALTEPL
jgi:hypothetical protein